MNVAEATEFVRSLELPALTSGRAGTGGEQDESLPAVPESGTAAGVVRASIVSFVADVSAQHRSDVLNSALLAQLAASKLYDRESQQTAWYDFYREVLTNLGWVGQAASFRKYQASGDEFTLAEAALKVIGDIVSLDGLRVLQSAIAALEALPEKDGRVVLFDRSVQRTGGGDFELVACSSEDGAVAMKAGEFRFSTTQRATRILSFAFSSSAVDVHTASQTMTLNPDVFATVRRDISEKLGERTKDYVAGLSLDL